MNPFNNRQASLESVLSQERVLFETEHAQLSHEQLEVSWQEHFARLISVLSAGNTAAGARASSAAGQQLSLQSAAMSRLHTVCSACSPQECRR